VPDRVAELSAALDRIDAGEPAAAEALCQDLLRADPGDEAALLLLGLAVGAQGDAARAHPLLIRAAHLHASGRNPCHDMATALVRLRCRPLIRLFYRDCLLHAPDDFGLRYTVAEYLNEASAMDDASDVLTEGLHRDPAWLAGRVLLGIVLSNQGRFSAANRAIPSGGGTGARAGRRMGQPRRDAQG
jgi:thioredoxin-like negative regulator of GroEL